jgi:hypothetical protein
MKRIKLFSLYQSAESKKRRWWDFCVRPGCGLVDITLFSAEELHHYGSSKRLLEQSGVSRIYGV